jgi:hypothetical protein
MSTAARAVVSKKMTGTVPSSSKWAARASTRSASACTEPSLKYLFIERE